MDGQHTKLPQMQITCLVLQPMGRTAPCLKLNNIRKLAGSPTQKRLVIHLVLWPWISPYNFSKQLPFLTHLGWSPPISSLGFSNTSGSLGVGLGSFLGGFGSSAQRVKHKFSQLPSLYFISFCFSIRLFSNISVIFVQLLFSILHFSCLKKIHFNFLLY